MGQPRPQFLFIFVLFKQNCSEKSVGVSGIQTRIVGVIENKFTRTRAILQSKKFVSAFLQIFQLTLGQKNVKSPWWQHSWTSVFHYLDPSLPLLKSGHEKLRAHILVNLFSMVGVEGKKLTTRPPPSN